jgi:hypothetical protein
MTDIRIVTLTVADNRILLTAPTSAYQRPDAQISPASVAASSLDRSRSGYGPT